MPVDYDRLAKKASQLRLSAISLAESMKSGNFKSVYRGQGIEFSDMREYLLGDNVRAIDWNVTARMGRAFIKQYEEDRELSVFLILDASRSMELASGQKTRLSCAQEVAALLLLAAEQNSGAVGAVFFDGKIQFSCAPKSGQNHSMMILSKLDSLNSIPEEEKSNGSVLPNAISGAARLLKKRSLVFVISDFRAAGWQNELAHLSQKHDVIAIKITDKNDFALPDVGTLPFFDAESKKNAVFPTRSKRFKSEWKNDAEKRTQNWKEFCTRHGAFPLILSTDDEAALVLSRFFKQKSALA